MAAPALLFAGGVAVSRLAALSAAEALLCLVLAAAARGVARGILAGRITAWTAWAAAGALAAAVHPPPAAPAIDLTPRRIEGCVVESSSLRGDRVQFTLAIQPEARVRVSWPIAEDGSLPLPLFYGQRVAAELRLQRVRGFRNAAGFDAEAYFARRGIFWTAAPARGARLERLPGACGSPWRRGLERLRAAALERIDAVHSSDATRAALMRGLLLGDKSGIRKVWVEDFRRTGTYHALVISGSHVTLVCGLFLLWRRFSGLGWRTVPLAASALAWLYALMAGADPPVLRAAAGFTLFAAGAALYRRLALLNTVAAVAIVFLALDPDQLFEASFQLSFLAVAALGAFFPGRPFRRGLDGRAMAAQLERKLAAETLHELLRLPVRLARFAVESAAALWRWGRTLFLASAAVQLSLALPMALLFHRLSITGFSANVVAVPFVSLAIPAGFLAAFTGWEWMGRIAGSLLDVSRRLVAWHAQLEPDWRIPDPPLWLAVLLFGTLIGWVTARRSGVRWLTGGLYCALLVLAVLHPFEPRSERGVLELAAIDAGQAESLLLALPGGAHVLVDAGGPAHHGRRRVDPFDAGEEVISPVLWSRGILRLDVLALSHLHEDHAAGAPSVIRNFRPREIWISFPRESLLWREIQAAARQAGSRIRSLRQGDQCPLPGVSCRVLAPPSSDEGGGRIQNKDSLVLEIRHGRHVLLLAGDIEPKREAELAEEGLLQTAHVLKVPHHGGRFSATSRLLEAVRPAVAVISAGENNSYGLPHREALARLSERRVLVLRTDRDGMVAVRTDGRYLEVRQAAGKRPAGIFDWE